MKSVGLIVILLAGCTVSRAAMIGGTAAAFAGVMLVTASPSSSCQPETGPNAVENSVGTGICNGIAGFDDSLLAGADRVVGASLLVIGAALLVAGVVTSHDDPPDEVKRVATAPPVRAMPGPVANPASMARVENRLAIQASIVAHAGQCQAAKVTADRLAAVDPALFQALVSRDLDLARCYGQ